MNYNFEKIYLSWRPMEKGASRIMVGEILIADDETVTFQYLKDGVKSANRQGFVGYPGLSTHQVRHTDPVSHFTKRLIDTSRSDAERLLNFWGVDLARINDKLYLLAMTQGMMQTDNFEFLAKYKADTDIDFVSDIAGLTYSQFKLSDLNLGEQLEFEREVDNPKDTEAIMVHKNGSKIGYIKQGHKELFQGADFNKIKLEVKHKVDERTIKELYLRIYNI